MNIFSKLLTSSGKVFSILLISLLCFDNKANAQGPFVAATHITGEYMYGNCNGNIKIRFLYQDRNYWGITKIDFFYRKSDGSFVQFAIAEGNWNHTNKWSDGWPGNSKFYSLSPMNSNNIVISDRYNEANLSYQYFVWNSVPAEAIVNGQVNIFSNVNFGTYSLVHTSSNGGSIPVIFPTLSPPSALTATNSIYCDKVKLDWQSPNSFPCSYDIEVYRNNSKIATLSGTAVTYEDFAAPQGNLQYNVKAVHTTGTGGKVISGSSFVANGARKPSLSAPSGITATENRCDGKVALNWNYYNTNPTYFHVSRSTAVNGTYTTVNDQIDGGERSFLTDVPNRSTTYYYKVGTIGDCGTSFSNTGYPGSSPTIPTKPTNVQASVNGANNAIIVTWADNSSDETGFNIERTILGGAGSTTIPVEAGVTSYTDNDVSACVRYIYRVRARNNCDPIGNISLSSATVNINPNISNSFNSTNNKLRSSKGYFSNMVQLEWSTVNVDLLNQYRIYRKPYGSTTDSVLIGTAGSGEGSFYDYTAISGVLYKYTVIGVLTCAGTPLYSNYTEDIGFKNAFGTVSGQLSYQGGFALRNAKVLVTPSAASFLGSSVSISSGGSLNVPSSSVLSFTNGITLETWFNSANTTGNKTLINLVSGSKSARIGLQADKLIIEVNNGSSIRNYVTTGVSGTFLANNYNQVTGVFKSDSLVLYLNGIRLGGVALSAYSYLPINSASITMGSGFVGNLDEVRVYDYGKSINKVSTDYGRKVNPDDAGLLAYYTFDENTVGYNGFFDYSRKGQVYNANHGTSVNMLFDKNNIPSVSQLSFASYTDSTGSYVVTNINYVGIGDIYTITPAFGTHSFSPVNRTVYIGDGSAVHSQQNFTDQSSFTVSGFVFYRNTSCAAEGINLKIDGEQVISNGSPVTTNQSGAFEIQVPIGNHIITVEKFGHVFSAGRFPTTGTYNFQKTEAGIQFVDSTLIKVVGRAVGGAIEAAKKPGLGLSVNNIGKTRLYFKSQLGGGCSVASITTNDSTGEYTAFLPPLIYTVDTAKVLTNPVLSFTGGSQALEVLDLTNAVNVYTSADTLYLPGSSTIANIRSTTYNLRRDFIYYTTPSVLLTRTTAKTATDSAFIGEISIPIDSVNSVSLLPNNPFTYPVFKQFKEYTAKVYAYDVYTNNDRNPVVAYKVPLNGRLMVNNALASGESAVQNINVVGGEATYTFRGGQPDITRNTANPAYSFTKTMQVTFFTTGNNGDRSINWLPNPGNTSFRGYIFGGRTRGSQFATSGPQKVDLILRDPPGSASFATWAKNTTLTSTKTFSTANKTGGGFEGQINLGFKWQTSAGIGVEFETESYFGGNESLGMTSESTAGKGGEIVESISSSIAISTGAGSDQVGSKADIFYGHSKNYVFGMADNLTLVPDSRCNLPNSVCSDVGYGGYKIGLNQSLALDPKEINTVFAYTVGEVEDIIIPNLIKLRNAILVQSRRPNGSPKYTINYTDTEADDYEQKFGANNDDPIWGESRNKNNPLTQELQDSTGVSYTFHKNSVAEPDSVRYYNNQIRLWKEALATNEREKYEAFTLNIGNVLNSGTNTSIGKASLSREFTSTKSTTTTRSEEVFFSENVGLGFTLDVAGSGFEFGGSVTVEETSTTEEGTTSEVATTIGYTLQDGDDGDLISVDVVDPKTGNGHMFKLRGGQTSCPYEGPEWSNYYRPGDTVTSATYFEGESGVKLSDGTAKRHVPKIQIPQPTKFNVPADQPATFTLQLGNESESDDDQEYSLRVVEVSNPNGAVLTIDGLDPNRNFSIPYATNISKTLSIRRGTEYYDYDSILLIFKSPCDDDLCDSAYVSVHFIPTCTEPFVFNPGDKWTLNNSFRDTMNVIINGYDYNFGGFKDITFQYKPSSSSQWNILQTFKKVTTDPLDREIPSIRPYIEYAWNMRQLPDGPYDIRAVSNCSAPGHADAKVASAVATGLADRVNPSPFGNPSPADGILSPNDEIQIQFNEPVDNASLSFQNFDIRGVLNGSALQNTASIHFDGNDDYLEIPTGLNLSKKTFTLEFWVKRETLGEQVVFSQGIDNAQYMSIGFDANNKFNFRIGNEVVRSNLAFDDLTSFHHFAVSYDSEADRCELFIDGVICNTGNTNIYNKYEGGGKTIIGKLSKDNSFGFVGNLRDFRLWNRTRTAAAIIGSFNKSLKGTEAGIIANWRFDEATGIQVKDYVRARHATIRNAVWQISPKGKSYRVVNEPLAIEAGDLAFTHENDFTIEFWFKSANTPGNVCLFSNGRGDSSDVNIDLKWSIEKNADGKIIVKHRGLNFEAVSNNYFDNNWHHFALVMQRATSITAFVDGNQQNTTNTSDFKQFGGDKFWLGVRGYQSLIGTETLDRHYNGYFDEVRIWNSSRTQEQINRDRVNRLSGTETGLVFYLPFETYTLNLGVPILTQSLADMLKLTRVISGTTANGSGLNDETPTIKLQRPVQSINFNYSVNQDKIILTPTTLAELIENVTLDVTVKDVYDLNGNKMQSPKTWIAYVDKNQVKWQDQEFNFVKKTGAALTFTSNIVNSGGAVKQYEIQNLPTWLSASPASGVVAPNSFKTITFTIDPNVNIGDYENQVQLMTDFGFPDGLLVSLKVFAEPPSTWNVNASSFQNAMSIVGQIRVNNIISTNADDKIAAFVNGECRGVASLQYYPQIDRYYAFLNVYSNVSSGENIEFKIWNAGAGKIHSDVTPHIQFISNGQIGSITTPQIFNATDKLTSYIPLSTGWNWVSFNLAMKDSNDLNALFRGIHSGTGDIFRSLTSLADYSALNGWVGALAGNSSGIKPEQSYRIRMSNLDTLIVNGVEIDPTTRPIKLDSGWNWIGFISQRNLSVTEAFSSLNASNGDLVKSQSQFALYDNNIGWVGSLTTMTPSKGYMYRSSANAVFAYPRSAMFGKTGVVENAYKSNFFNVDVTKYEKNMNAIVDAGVCTEALASGRFSLGAYADNQLRGATKVTTLSNGRNVFFITMMANSEQDNLTFKLLDEKTGNTYDLSGSLKFENNKLVGTISQPHSLTTVSNFNCNDFASTKVSGLQIFAHPNPFNHNVVVNVQGLNAAKLKVKVLDVTGKLIDAFEHNTLNQVNTDINWNPEERGITLKQGFYFVEVEGNNQTLRTKIIKY
jgi:hypothetical protein